MEIEGEGGRENLDHGKERNRLDHGMLSSHYEIYVNLPSLSRECRVVVDRNNTDKLYN